MIIYAKEEEEEGKGKKTFQNQLWGIGQYCKMFFFGGKFHLSNNKYKKVATLQIDQKFLRKVK